MDLDGGSSSSVSKGVQEIPGRSAHGGECYFLGRFSTISERLDTASFGNALMVFLIDDLYLYWQRYD